MFRPLRTLISLAVLAGMVWFAFAVELGDKTLAEHVDTISATPEAKQLIEGTRQTIDPALDDVRDRMLGEYVEAPTFIGEDEVLASGSKAHAAATEIDAPEPKLPGRRRARTRAPSDEPPPEPARPGRRLRPNVLAVIEPAPEPEPVEPPVIARPVELPRVPWPRHEPQDDRSFLDPMLELARSRPPAPELEPIPIVQPMIDPALPELPSER